MTTKKGNKELQLRDNWMEAASKVKSLEAFEKFYKKLCAHEHDYGTIVHAVSALGIAGCWLMEHSPQGGITGFQAGCVMWDLVRGWMPEYKDGHLKILDYDDLLWPQNLDRFQHIIPKEVAEELHKKAKKEVKEHKRGKDCSEAVYDHWVKIANSWLPDFITMRD